MPAVRTDKMIVKEEKERDKKEKATRQSFSCAECRRYVAVPACFTDSRRFSRRPKVSVVLDRVAAS